MIGDLLTLITKEVTTYIDAQVQLPSGKKTVLLYKPNRAKGEIDIPDNTIALSLLNIEQELSIREATIKKEVINGKVYKQDPAVYINLQVIFIANFQNDYVTELNYITKVIEFFQQKATFTPQNTKGLEALNIDKLTFKLNTLELGEQHNIWNMLGTTYMPSVVYKISMLTIQKDKELTEASIVRNVQIDTKRR